MRRAQRGVFQILHTLEDLLKNVIEIFWLYKCIGQHVSVVGSFSIKT